MYKHVADLLDSGEIVAIFQGRIEAGPRALGNRSLLYDPRRNDGERINNIKGREPWRPFAASVMLEHARDWFDMATLKESPYMMYSIPVRDEVKDRIPIVVSADGTCRIQTVTKQQNYHYYNLIKAFYSKTGVTMVFNTSFNLAGEVIVHTLDHAIDMLSRCQIKYLYLPDKNELRCIS